jgi:hypothetical protein
MQKKRSAFSAERFCVAQKDTLINYDIVRIALADHPLRINKAVHVNRDPAVVYEHKVSIPDQPEMVRPKSLDEELLRMPSKTKHFAVTRLELLHVHLRGLIHVRLIRAPHVGLVRAPNVRLVRTGTFPRCILLYLLRTTLNVRLWLSTHVCARLRFCLRFARLLRSFHLLPFRRCSSLWFFRLPLRLLWLRLLT